MDAHVIRTCAICCSVLFLKLCRNGPDSFQRFVDFRSFQHFNSLTNRESHFIHNLFYVQKRSSRQLTPQVPSFPSLARLPNLRVACRLFVTRPYDSPLGWSRKWFFLLCVCVTTSYVVLSPNALSVRACSMFETSCLCVETPVQLVTMGPSKGSLRGSLRIWRRIFSVAVSSAPWTFAYLSILFDSARLHFEPQTRRVPVFRLHPEHRMGTSKD